jgi:Mat/Ecp fimbriae periplasmic chaperone
MRIATFTAFSMLAGLAAVSASAEMVLSQVIVDLHSDKPPRDDIEVWNDTSETMYVSAEPFLIVAPGTPNEQRVPATRPDESGLLVSPQRLVLAAGERRTVRIAAVGQRPTTDRVYRVAIKPVAGSVSSNTDALKVFVGYDALVIVRPDDAMPRIEAERTRSSLELRNDGNSAVELFEGRQCDNEGGNCQSLPAKRLYAGAVWEQALPYETKVSYRSAIGKIVRQLEF